MNDGPPHAEHLLLMFLSHKEQDQGKITEPQASIPLLGYTRYMVTRYGHLLPSEPALFVNIKAYY